MTLPVKSIEMIAMWCLLPSLGFLEAYTSILEAIGYFAASIALIVIVLKNTG